MRKSGVRHGGWTASLIVALLVPAVFIATPVARSHHHFGPLRTDRKNIKPKADRTVRPVQPLVTDPSRHLRVVPADTRTPAPVSEPVVLARLSVQIREAISQLPVGSDWRAALQTAHRLLLADVEQHRGSPARTLPLANQQEP